MTTLAPRWPRGTLFNRSLTDRPEPPGQEANALLPNERRAVLRSALTLGLVMGLGACAAPRRAPPADTPPEAAWYGRLALKVDSLPPQSFNASFELLGHAEAGSLRLFTPLGGTAGEVRWQAGRAELQTGQDTRRYPSMDELTLALTGAALPLPALCHWLRGEQVTVPGWQADLSQLPEGRLLAQRLDPAPVVDLRVLLDR